MVGSCGAGQQWHGKVRESASGAAVSKQKATANTSKERSSTAIEATEMNKSAVASQKQKQQVRFIMGSSSKGVGSSKSAEEVSKEERSTSQQKKGC
ncbi:hypothetical protein NL676_032221 [Syzygium grande]|nr:hypothetical protein NL676_032221 [Syzygium grande]